MPILILIEIAVIGIAAYICVETTWILRSVGWKKALAWVDLALVGLPALVAGVGGQILRARGLAWRSCVKLPCGLAFVGGLLLMLVFAGAVVWKRMAGWKPAFRVPGRGVAVTALGFLFLVIGWYGALFSAIWAGTDREIEKDGQILVAEYSWMDAYYYEHHNALIRGEKCLWIEH